jgi:hypothetical protein
LTEYRDESTNGTIAVMRRSALVLLVSGAGIAMLIGATVGAAYARMQRQWSDYRKVKAGLPAMKTTAWLLTRLFGSSPA